MSDEQLLREFLEKEIEENTKAARYGSIMFLILCLVIFGYFRWLRTALEEVIQPRTLAKVLVLELEARIPLATKSLADSIREALPKIAKYTIDSVVDNAIPEMRKNAVGFLEEHSRSLSEFAAFTGHEIFIRVLLAKRSEIEQANPLDGQPVTADLVVLALEKNLELTLDRELTISMADEVDADSDGESVAVKLHKSAQALRNINAKLNSLANSGDGSRHDVMSKRIIGAWWGWLRSSQMANADGAEVEEPPSSEDKANAFQFGEEKEPPEDSSDEIEVLPQL